MDNVLLILLGSERMFSNLLQSFIYYIVPIHHFFFFFFFYILSKRFFPLPSKRRLANLITLGTFDVYNILISNEKKCNMALFTRDGD